MCGAGGGASALACTASSGHPDGMGNQRGMSFVTVLVAMLILAALYFGYFKLPNVGGERAGPVVALDNSKAVACRTNRQNIERSIQLWSVDHPGEQPTIRALQSGGIHIPSCPQGGRYTIVDHEVHCSVHQ